MSGAEIATLIGAIVTALTAFTAAIAGTARFYRKAVREAGERLNERDRADAYEKQSRETIAQKDAEIAALREQAAAWQRLAEYQDPRSEGRIRGRQG
jgi:leucyl aminopeptidase